VASSDCDAPLIGLTTYAEQARHGPWDEMSALLSMEYVAAVIRAGGTAVLLPPSPVDRVTLLDALSGLVLSGGPDVDPAMYGAASNAETDEPRRERDAWEAALCRAALERDMPLLAVCRGLQVMNVALGGTLHQHLPDVVGSDRHRGVRGQMARVTVTVEEGTEVAGVLGTSVEGLCHHHQAIDRLGRGMRAVARAEDGTIEAAEVDGRRFALGIQWHPEADTEDDRLFKALIQAAAGYREDTGP
jgi:gamma-glutamyl-gamma-aminobutyrate hydrolase PuuD